MKLVGVELTALFVQDQDSCGPSEDKEQALEVEVTDAGGGPYFVLRTDRWALDPADLKKLAKQLDALMERTKVNA